MTNLVRTALASVRRAYRASGADRPFGDPLPAHGVAMEGYFWRFTDPASGRVVIALNGVNQAHDGTWSTLGLAAHPHGFLHTSAYQVGSVAATDGLGVRAGDAFHGTANHVHVDLAPDAQLDVQVTNAVPWPRRSLGGSSVFQPVPGLHQYWHPWLLGGSAQGRATVGTRT